jgi:hypothetical protein
MEIRLEDGVPPPANASYCELPTSIGQISVFNIHGQKLEVVDSAKYLGVTIHKKPEVESTY